MTWDRVFYQVLLNGEFDLMSKYLETLSSFLDSSKKRLADFVQQEASGLDEEAKYDLREWYEDDFAELEEDFPRLLLNGFIVTWYSFVERQLIELYERRTQGKGKSLTWYSSVKQQFSRLWHGRNRGKQKSIIERAYRGFSDVDNYRIENKSWEELKKIGGLRNHIVHRGGERLLYSQKKPRVKYTPVKQKDPLTMEEYTVYVHVEQNLYAYLKKHSLVAESGFRLTPDVEYCKHLVRLCVQRRLARSVGINPTQVRTRSLVAWMAGRREINDLKPIDRHILRMVASHRAATKVNAEVASKMSSPGGRARNCRAKAV